MTVAFDAQSSVTSSNNPGTTLTWNHTPVGTPTAVAVMITMYVAGSLSGTPTYGGVSMTQVAAVTWGGALYETHMYGLANPPAGTQAVVVTYFGAGTYAVADAITVTGSDTATCFTNGNSATGTSTAPSVSVTSNSGELTVDMVANGAADAGLTAGGSQTVRVGPSTGGGSGFGFASSSLPSSATSTTMSWTQASHEWAIVAASFKASAPVAPALNNQQLVFM